MFGNCKYVTFGHDTWPEFMIIFPSHLDHAETAKLFLEGHNDCKVVSAGFLDVNSRGDIYCSGSSASLKVGVHKHDNTLATRMLKDV